jgi:hypothetical protein
MTGREYNIWKFGKKFKKKLDEVLWDSFGMTRKTEMQRKCVTRSNLIVTVYTLLRSIRIENSVDVVGNKSCVRKGEL